MFAVTLSAGSLVSRSYSTLPPLCMQKCIRPGIYLSLHGNWTLFFMHAAAVLRDMKRHGPQRGEG